MKTWKIILSAFLCMVFISQIRIPALASKPSVGMTGEFDKNQADTKVSLKGPSKAPVITLISKDMEVLPGRPFRLEAEATGKPFTKVLWKLSRDGWKSYEEVAAGLMLDTQILPENKPYEMPYSYALEVTNESGTAEARVGVFVSGTKEYEYKKLESNGVTVEGLIHKSLQSPELVVVQRPSDEYPQLEGMLAEEHLPLRTYDVNIVDGAGKLLPYIGTLEVGFPVGSIYDSETLRVFHGMKDNQVETLHGKVNTNMLKVSTESLSPFMIEAPRSNTHAVEVKVIGNGTVSPDGTVYVTKHESQSFVMTGDAGHNIKGVKLDGQPVSYSGNTFTHPSVTQDHELEVTFEKPSTGGDSGSGDGGSGGGSGGGPGGGSGGGSGGPGNIPGGGSGTNDNSQPGRPPGGGSDGGSQNEVFYQIKVNARGSGSVSPADTVSVRHGESKTFYFYPQKGYKVGQVSVNGVPVTVLGSSYTFTAVTGHAELEVIFEAQTGSVPRGKHTVTATAGKGGAISPEGVNTVLYGGDFYVYFQPDEGYQVSKVTVDGREAEIGNSFHFINVTADRKIHVEFEKSTKVSAKDKRHEIKVMVQGEYGKVSPDGNTWVNEGGSQTIYFYPSEGYEVSGVTVNGKTVEWNPESYTLEDIRKDMNVEVAFAPVKSSDLNCSCPLCTMLGTGCICPLCWIVLLLILVLSLLAGRIIYVKYKKNKNAKES